MNTASGGTSSCAMAIKRTEIFIASRMGEFEEIRTLLREKIAQYKVLPIEAVDFSDGRMSPHPALRECLAAVNRAEIMILLLGDSYGNPAPGQTSGRGPALSYTHLEYREAMKQGRPVVLPFLFVDDPAAKAPPRSSDPRLSSFYDELIDSHICKYLPRRSGGSELVDEIFMHLIGGFFRFTLQATGAEGGRDEDDDGDDGFSDDAGEQGLSTAELDYLEANHDRAAGDDDDSAGDDQPAGELERLLRQPARAAAAEQMAIGFDALKLGERFVALRHFRRCLEHDPLNPRANYWLARILATTQKREHSEEAIRLAERTIRIAARDGAPILAAVSCIVAARCSSDLQDHEAGIRYAQDACAWTPKLARAHLELAAQYALAKRPSDAAPEIRRAFKAYPKIIHVADRDPAFREIGRDYQQIRDKIGRELQQRLAAVWDLEDRTRGAFDLPAEAGSESSRTTPPHQLVRLATTIRAAGRDQLGLLRSIADRLLAMGKILANKQTQLTAARKTSKDQIAADKTELRRRALAAGGALLVTLLGFALHPVAGGLFAVGTGALLIRLYPPWRAIERATAEVVVLEEQEEALQPERKKLAAALERYEEHVLAFERTVMTDGLASPVRRRHRPRPGDVLVVRDENAVPVLLADPPDRAEGDWAIIPPALRPPAAAEVVAPPRLPCLVRVAAGSHSIGQRRITRWGAYFTSAPETTGGNKFRASS
jgi:tetratricopeptide (TPR) repeat protein